MYKKLASFILVISLIFTASTGFAAENKTSPREIIINSDGVTDPYELITKLLGEGSIDGSDQKNSIVNAVDPVLGDVFDFMLHSSGDIWSGDTAGDRQRNEIKLSPKGSPTGIKRAVDGETVTYQWKFNMDANFQTSPPKFCHIFQIKAAKGSEASAPIVTFTVNKEMLELRHYSYGSSGSIYTTLAFALIKDIKATWIQATVSVLNKDDGYLSVLLETLDGETVLSYSGKADMWRRPESKDERGAICETDLPSADGQCNYPKWGIYRGLFTGTKEVHILFSDFKIIMDEAVLQIDGSPIKTSK